jgi:hypothetical protein
MLSTATTNSNYDLLLMRVTGKNFVAGIVWEKKLTNFGRFNIGETNWSIQKFAPILKWVCNKSYSIEYIREVLTDRMGCQIEEILIKR